MSVPAPLPDISIIICTRNRPDSLRATLECLASANRQGIRTEVVVVDNAGKDGTAEITSLFADRMPVRYLYEPTIGVYGKSHALNRAIDDGRLGEVVAVLDDDISVESDWFQEVMAICNGCPDKDIFTGQTYVIWPSDMIPDWAQTAGAIGSLFSVATFRRSDNPFPNGGWFLGGHFWFRSRVLTSGRRFKDVWNSEADFQLDLVDAGYSPAVSENARAGHRVQAVLLRKDTALDRAKKAREKASLRLRPFRNTVRQARAFHEHPLQARLFCLLNQLRWCLLYLTSYLYPTDAHAFERRLVALERMGIASEYLRVAGQCHEYSLWKRARLT